jgi:hypothetical protein
MKALEVTSLIVDGQVKSQSITKSGQILLTESLPKHFVQAVWS